MQTGGFPRMSVEVKIVHVFCGITSVCSTHLINHITLTNNKPLQVFAKIFQIRNNHSLYILLASYTHFCILFMAIAVTKAEGIETTRILRSIIHYDKLGQTKVFPSNHAAEKCS